MHDCTFVNGHQFWLDFKVNEKYYMKPDSHSAAFGKSSNNEVTVFNKVWISQEKTPIKSIQLETEIP